MGIHDAHRERIRKRFDSHGAAFEDYQLLEMLLYQASPGLTKSHRPRDHHRFRQPGRVRKGRGRSAAGEGRGREHARSSSRRSVSPCSYEEPRTKGVVVCIPAMRWVPFSNRSSGASGTRWVQALHGCKVKLLCCSVLGAAATQRCGELPEGRGDRHRPGMPMRNPGHAPSQRAGPALG
jgi:hypothetical protein